MVSWLRLFLCGLLRRCTLRFLCFACGALLYGLWFMICYCLMYVLRCSGLMIMCYRLVVYVPVLYVIVYVLMCFTSRFARGCFCEYILLGV